MTSSVSENKAGLACQPPSTPPQSPAYLDCVIMNPEATGTCLPVLCFPVREQMHLSDMEVPPLLRSPGPRLWCRHMGQAPMKEGRHWDLTSYVLLKQQTRYDSLRILQRSGPGSTVAISEWPQFLYLLSKTPAQQTVITPCPSGTKCLTEVSRSEGCTGQGQGCDTQREGTLGKGSHITAL